MRFFCITVLASICLIPWIVLADDPVVVPGWEGFSSGSVQGIRLENKSVGYSSSVVAEIDGDASNGKEIAVGGSDGYVYVYKSDGSLHWSYKMPNADCGATGTTNKLYSSPAVGELFGDGIPYVVVGYGGVGGADCGGGIVALLGPNIEGKKRRRWHFNGKRFLRRKRIWAAQYGFFGAPTLGDVNQDGVLEVAAASFDRGVYLFDARGKVVWRYNAADTVWSSPVLFNAVGKPRLEMIVATDISANSFLNPPTSDGGILYALRTKGVRKRRVGRRWKKPEFTHYNFRDSKLIIWQTEFNQTLFSSPVIADLLPSNTGMELAIASGCYFPENSNNKRGKWIKIVDVRTGTVLNTLNTHACSPSSVAVGDIDEDGQLEIVATINGDESVGGDGSSRLAAYNPEDSDPFWETIPRDKFGNYSMGGHFMSPVIADIDGNGSLEVLAPNSRTVGVYAGKTGAALTCQGDSCDGETAFLTGSALFSTPTVADITDDGIPELVIGSARSGNGALFGWTDLQSAILSDPGIHESFFAPWPTHRGDAQRSGIYSAD